MKKKIIKTNKMKKENKDWKLNHLSIQIEKSRLENLEKTQDISCLIFWLMGVLVAGFYDIFDIMIELKLYEIILFEIIMYTPFIIAIFFGVSALRNHYKKLRLESKRYILKKKNYKGKKYFEGISSNKKIKYYTKKAKKILKKQYGRLEYMKRDLNMSYYDENPDSCGDEVWELANKLYIKDG